MKEKIDILNEKGEPTKEVRFKDEVHRLGLWHKTNHIWILNDKGELLLQKRAERKENYGGYWDISAAGHISAGETDIASALREIKEELGVEITERELYLLGVVTQEAIINNGNYIDKEYQNIYIIEKDISLSEMKMQESEVEDLKYIHWEELKKMLSDKNEKILHHPDEYKLLFKYLEEKYNK